ncbi:MULTISPECIES: DUF6215 domain-containing protein [unclassified Streptomyces]|uniref:DUF6215 domain-containing protein n=1 Tax=unclassified Streptomyces TaxID=2593676 RepID=UPI00224D9FCD|nr:MULTISPECIES: DUF6215 domain-containing protein [unclassified Streptomyces]MCX4987989.1 DUF6215 domain-containing protein [Streptomyces sp. NBC_00568]MCX5006879.1 DUF6215 domain-containing protein [Streptomyces sp. NBC_00638]
MTDGAAGSKKGAGAGAQAVSAVLMVALVAAGIWLLAQVLPQSGGAAGEPATCSKEDNRRPAKYVSGTQLCEALNREDLPAMLGTPDEHAETASGSGGYFTVAGETRVASPEANVTLTSYSVKLSATYDRLSVADWTDLLGTSAEPRTILGHPAVLYSDRTIAITFGSDQSDAGPGGIARRLVVAQDAKDGGGAFEVAIWRQDDVTPDDAALLRVAEAVLPTVPGWTNG